MPLMRPDIVGPLSELSTSVRLRMRAGARATAERLRRPARRPGLHLEIDRTGVAEQLKRLDDVVLFVDYRGRTLRRRA
jgi:hypothetical protein